jgi:apolipoprotein N-acyltransferase
VVAHFSYLEGRQKLKKDVFPFYFALRTQITVSLFSSNYSPTLKYMKQNRQTKVLKYLTKTKNPQQYQAREKSKSRKLEIALLLM